MRLIVAALSGVTMALIITITVPAAPFTAAVLGGVLIFLAGVFS